MLWRRRSVSLRDDSINPFTFSISYGEIELIKDDFIFMYCQ